MVLTFGPGSMVTRFYLRVFAERNGIVRRLNRNGIMTTAINKTLCMRWLSVKLKS